MKKIGLFLIVIMVSACAQKADKIKPAYVSPLQYSDYSCSQIKGEISRVGRKMNEVAGVQDKTASDDSVAMGVGLILFWPALFFIDSSDERTELARLKGEFDTLEEVAIKKNCTVAQEIQSIRDAEDARRAENKVEYKRETND